MGNYDSVLEISFFLPLSVSVDQPRQEMRGLCFVSNLKTGSGDSHFTQNSDAGEVEFNPFPQAILTRDLSS